jgi:hypothetical protein
MASDVCRIGEGALMGALAWSVLELPLPIRASLLVI